MKKEVVVAILIGTLMGLGGAYGIWKMAAGYLNKPQTKSVNNAKSPTPQGSANNQNNDRKSAISLTLTKIEPYDVVTDDTIALSGATSANSIVVASTYNDIVIMRANDSGVFEGEFSLDAGINFLKFDVYRVNEKTSMDIPIVFSSEFLDSTTVTNQTQKDATSSSDIRGKVQEKLQANSKRATAYIGIVTDLTDNSVQVKNSLGQIQQIKLLTDITQYAKNTGKSNSEIKRSDIAIGDYVIAMGFKDQDQTLQARRILVTTEIKNNAANIFHGTVEAIDTKSINIISKNSSEKLSVDLSKKPKITNEKNDKAIAAKTITTAQEVIIFNLNRVFVLDSNTN